MSKRAEDPLIPEIRIALMPGRFVRWNEVSGMVSNLDRVQERVEELVKAGEAGRAVRLYEIFLSGVYAKIEEADDECDLANLFHGLICGWIQARQAAGLCAKETVTQLLNWMKNDSYGFCHDIEKDAIKVLRKAAKLYRALGLRIVNAGKSKYYHEALEHFEKARDLYWAIGQPAEWAAVVQSVRIAHSRKSGFVSAFEKIVSGKVERVPSFAEQAQERWKRLTV